MLYFSSNSGVVLKLNEILLHKAMEALDCENYVLTSYKHLKLF